MDSYVVVVLALIGFATVVAVGAAALAVLYEEWSGGRSNSVEPYREGLDAAARISAMAFETERTMQAAAEAAKEERH